MNIGVRGGMPSTPRYPTPIQRPVAYQQGGGAPGNNIMSGSGRHRPQHNSSHTPPSRPPPNINKMQSGQAGGQPYYGAHGLYNMKMVMKYQIIVVGVVTRLWTGCLKDCDSLQGKRFHYYKMSGLAVGPF